jgi:hypothetical protein
MPGEANGFYELLPGKQFVEAIFHLRAPIGVKPSQRLSHLSPGTALSSPYEDNTFGKKIGGSSLLVREKIRRNIHASEACAQTKGRPSSPGCERLRISASSCLLPLEEPTQSHFQAVAETWMRFSLVLDERCAAALYLETSDE